jgi:hypothetical protein
MTLQDVSEDQSDANFDTILPSEEGNSMFLRNGTGSTYVNIYCLNPEDY